jgi:hypothetical protein
LHVINRGKMVISENVPDIRIFLTHTNHYTLVARTSNNGPD